MIRSIIYLVIIIILSSLLYLVFNDAGNVSIYILDYYINLSVGIFCVFALLSVLLVAGILGILWWLKNLPGNLVKWRDDYNENKVVNRVFDIICALESENKDLAIRLYQRCNFYLIKHPIVHLLSWKVLSLDERRNEGDAEKALLLMKEDSKTFVPAVKELINHKLKSADFEVISQYLVILEKMSYKPNWFYRIKIIVCMAMQRWDEALHLMEKIGKLHLFNSAELQDLQSLVYYMKAKSLLNQNLVSEAISVLRKSLNSSYASAESIVLLVDLLYAQDKRKDAIEVISKGWKLNPDYQLIAKMLVIYEDLPIGKRFEELEKLITINNSRSAYLQLAQSALNLNLLSKCRKYLDLAKDETDDSYRKLEAVYNLLVQDDARAMQHYMKEFLIK